MRLGIIGSSGGASLSGAVECLRRSGERCDPVIVVDRACGMYDWAVEEGFPVYKIPYTDALSFSSEALRCFRENNVENVLLFYTRRVCRPLIGNIPVFNIHPAPLPLFRGLRGAHDALRAGVKTVGACLHGADEELDAGPIIAQIASKLPTPATKAAINKISYLQKVYLTLVLHELIQDFGMSVDIVSRKVRYRKLPSFYPAKPPSIENSALADAFNRLQEKEDCRVVYAR